MTAMTRDVSDTPSLVQIYLREAWYEFLRTWRMPAFVFPTLAFPALFYVMFALLLPGNWGRFDRAEYLLATYGVFGAIGPALFGFGIGLATEREHGWLDLKRISPMPLAAYFCAKVAMAQFFALIVLLELSALALISKPSMGLGRWSLMLIVIAIGSLPFCTLGLLIGAYARVQSAAAIVNLVYLPMAVLSGLWIPLFAFPKLVQQLAPIWPSYHLAQIALGVSGQIDGVRYGLHALVLLAMSAVFLTLAMRQLRRSDRR